MIVTSQLRNARLILVILCDIFVTASSINLLPNCNVTIVVNSSSPEGVITSPGFPTSYYKHTQSYSCWYSLTLDDPSRRLQLIFEDFHLNSDFGRCDSNEVDLLTIHSSVLTESYCGCRRPLSKIYDSGELMLQLNVVPARITDVAFRGFRVSYRSLSASEHSELREIDSYSFRPDLSSGYTMVSGNSRLSIPFDIDALYYIEAGTNRRIMITAVFENVASSNISLEIRDGYTSQSPLLNHVQRLESGDLLSTQSAVYVRWRGLILDPSVVLLLYITSFTDPISLSSCGSTEYFLCANQRCIKSTLTCDKMNNCGDWSDEMSLNPQDICYVNRCLSSPCLNGGVCQTSSSILCQCRDGFWGVFCQLSNTECLSSPCLNGGTCQPYSSRTGVHCFCRSGFTGKYCDINNTTNTDYTDLQHTSIMIGAFVGAVCLLSICWLIAMARKRQTDEPPGRIQRIVSVHSRDERGMRPSVTQGAIDLPPNYSDCVFEDDELSPQLGKPTSITDVPPPITEEEENESEGLELRRVGLPHSVPPMSPPPTYESVEFDEEDGITFNASSNGLPDVVSQDRSSFVRQTSSSHLDTVV